MHFWVSNDDQIKTPSISFVDFPDEGGYEQYIDKLGDKSGKVFYNVHIELFHTYRIWNAFGKAFTRSRPVYVDVDKIQISFTDDMDIWSRALLTQAFVLIDTNPKSLSILRFEVKEDNANKKWQKGIDPETLKLIQPKICDLKSKGEGLKKLRHEFLAHKNRELYQGAHLKLPKTDEPFDMGILADYLEIASDILNIIAIRHNIQRRDYMLFRSKDPKMRRIP